MKKVIINYGNIHTSPKRKKRVLLDHCRHDINAGKNGTYRMLYSADRINKKEVAQSESAIKLIEKLIF